MYLQNKINRMQDVLNKIKDIKSRLNELEYAYKFLQQVKIELSWEIPNPVYDQHSIQWGETNRTITKKMAFSNSTYDADSFKLDDECFRDVIGNIYCEIKEQKESLETLLSIINNEGSKDEN